jgi:acyl-CoA reductase-like NAD-dependent aldehyde dehydrogenase
VANGLTLKRERLFQFMVCILGFDCANLEPSSAEVLGHVADMSRDDFIKAIKIADKGFRKYSISTTFAERGAQLRKWFELINENVDDCIPSSKLTDNSG